MKPIPGVTIFDTRGTCHAWAAAMINSIQLQQYREGANMTESSETKPKELKDAPGYLRLLAAWFDMKDSKQEGVAVSDEVQNDLRSFADQIDALNQPAQSVRLTLTQMDVSDMCFIIGWFRDNKPELSKRIEDLLRRDAEAKAAGVVSVAILSSS